MNRILKKGSQGPDVKALQDALNFHIRRLAPLKLDGSFGALTDQRLREFQRVNGLAADGKMGPLTHAQIYEVTTVDLAVGIERRQPGAAVTGSPRFQMPPLPPFTLPPIPGLPPPPLVLPPIPGPGQRYFLTPGTFGPIPGTPGQAHVLQFKLETPTRKDPADPAVESRKVIVELIERLGFDTAFRAWLISKVPNPVKSVKPPSEGFQWGVEPILPHSFPVDSAGAKGNAQFSITVTRGNGPGPVVQLAAWGDTKIVLDHIAQEGRAHVRAQVEGQVSIGVTGRF